MVKTTEELKTISDARLLEIYEIAKVHMVDFDSFYCVEYSFGTIVNELQSRGYRLRWVKN